MVLGLYVRVGRPPALGHPVQPLGFVPMLARERTSFPVGIKGLTASAEAEGGCLHLYPSFSSPSLSGTT